MSQAGTVVERVALASEAQGRRTHARRRAVEQALALAEHLPADQAFLLRQVFEHGLKVRDIARQLGRDRHVVYRRIRSILRRLGSPLFAFIVSRGSSLPPAVLRSARLVICHGLSHGEVAARTGQSLYTVRRDLLLVRTLARV